MKQGKHYTTVILWILLIAIAAYFGYSVVTSIHQPLTTATVMEYEAGSGYYAAGGAGDKKLVYRTDVINAYPEYPVFEGEKYVSLAYKYLLIDQDYRLAVLNEVLCNVEYQPDGSSNNMFRQYWKNPRGFAFWRTVKMQYPESFQRLVMDCIHYCSSSQIAGNRNYIRESPKKLLTVACTPLGWMLTGYIRRKAGEYAD